MVSPLTIPTLPVTPDERGDPDSEMTRLLCAGVRLDIGFARQVIKVLLDDRDRFAAPAYGYDAVPVLGHALDARTLRRTRIAALVPILIVLIELTAYGPIDPISGILLCLWATWLVVFIERLVALHNIVCHLKRPNGHGTGFHGEYPRSDLLPDEVARNIAQEQDPRTSLVYYGGYLPFVGAGDRTRNWAFTVLLDAAQTTLPAALGGPSTGPTIAAAAEPFTVDELTTYVRERLATVLTTESPDGQRIEQLSIDRRWYRKAIGTRRPSPPPTELSAAEFRRTPNGPALYDSAREYLCVRVGTWDQELVTSVFLSFDLKGRMLYTELNAYVLPPIKPKYRLVDELPDGVGASLLLRLGWHATKGALLELVDMPVTAVRAIVSRLRRSGAERFEADDLTRYARGIKDFGARTSIRELAAVSAPRHFFQEIDAQKYIKIIERRLLEVVIDFLDAKKVDTREFRDRQANVLNVGVLNSGSGTVHTTGGLAVGSNATAAAR
ncbi:MAG TPA: hypothetical protein VG756_11140 [Pseudonocardiaceae bacterium]|jgi:hypothetical protein|nr:hypothetical protein [Pseudonocardiaceae bacterium]